MNITAAKRQERERLMAFAQLRRNPPRRAAPQRTIHRSMQQLTLF